MADEISDEYVSLSQATKLVNKSKGSIGNVIKNEKLTAKRKHNSNQYLIKKSDLLALFPPLPTPEPLPDPSEKIADLEWQLKQEKERATDLEKELEVLKFQCQNLSEQLEVQNSDNFNDVKFPQIPTNFNPNLQQKTSLYYIAKTIKFLENSGIIIEGNYDQSFANLGLLFRFLGNYNYQFRFHHTRRSNYNKKENTKFLYSMNDDVYKFIMYNRFDYDENSLENFLNNNFNRL